MFCQKNIIKMTRSAKKHETFLYMTYLPIKENQRCINTKKADDIKRGKMINMLFFSKPYIIIVETLIAVRRPNVFLNLIKFFVLFCSICSVLQYLIVQVVENVPYIKS